MNSRQTISFPADVAAAIADLPAGQVSAYVTEAVRRRLLSDSARAALRAAGHREYPFDPQASAARLADAQVSDSVRHQAIGNLAEMTGQDSDALATTLDRSAAAAGW